jgi:hypothetical protein
MRGTESCPLQELRHWVERGYWGHGVEEGEKRAGILKKADE